MANYLIHYNPYHDPKTGRFDNVPSYGGKGISAPLYSARKIDEPNKTDYVIKKGSRYYRVTNEQNEKFKKRTYAGGGDHDNLDDKIQLYVETLSSFYTEEGIKKNVYLNELETKKDILIAGKNTVESILKEIGGKDADDIIKSLNTENMPMPEKPNKKYGLFGKTRAYKEYKKQIEDFYKDSENRTRHRDFLYKDEYKIADTFIQKLKNKGYSGLSDPADGTLVGHGLDPDATIFIDDVLKLKAQKIIRER